MGLGLGSGELVFTLLVLLITIVPLWRIVAKAGYPGALSLLIVVPVVNLIAIFAFAFSTWPIERSARA